MDEFAPGNKTIYVVFDEESEFPGPRTPKVSPDQVVEENRTPDKFIIKKTATPGITGYPGF